MCFKRTTIGRYFEVLRIRSIATRERYVVNLIGQEAANFVPTMSSHSEKVVFTQRLERYYIVLFHRKRDPS